MEIFAAFLLIVISFVCVGYSIFLVGVLWGSIFGAPYVPTNHTTVKKMLSLAELKPSDIVYDLGSGDGRLVFQASKKAQSATGYEISFPIYAWSKLKQKLHYPKASIWNKSFFKADLRNADVVFCYLLTHTMKNLKSKFEKELKKGARIVCHGFEIPGWQPEIHIPKKNDQGSIRVYIMT